MESPQSQRSSHSEIDDRGMSLPGRPTELLEGKEPRAWINKEEWNSYIEGDTYDSRAPSDVSIFRVPIILKEQEKEAYYVPKIVSLGPYHHRSEKLAPMGRHKGRALRRMMTRSNTRRGNHLNILEFSDIAKEEITKLENKIRYSYEENIGCDGETLAMMLTLDGCFILEILRTGSGDELEEASKYYDPIFGEIKIDHTGRAILQDILKLENQIPLIVLQDLLQLEVELNSYDLLAFLEQALSSFFNPFGFDTTKWFNRQPHEQELEPVHLLDLLHGLIVSPPCHHDDEGQLELVIGCCNTGCRGSCSILHQERDKLDKTGKDDTEDSRNPWNKFKCGSSWCTMQLKHTPQKKPSYNRINLSRSPRTTELRKAGINFRTCNGGIKQIKFESNSATIYLPPITIEDDTEVLFRNLIAFEMCKPSENNYVASYVRLMDDLIDSNEDVALLRRMGIVTNYLGSDAEVAELFNGLGRGVFLRENIFFDQLAQQVKAHYHSRTKIQIAKLVDEHFSSPWKFLGLAGATILLLLAILQTIYTIISVYK